MKVRVLRPALDDLAAGRKFYDRQSEGVGDYFFDSLFAEIDSWSSTLGFTACNLAIIACWRSVSLMPFTIASRKARRSFTGFSIVVEIPSGSSMHFEQTFSIRFEVRH